MSRKPKVLVAMSGGVDSSVAAALLCEQGYDVIGMTMRLADAMPAEDRGPRSCCSVEDVGDARTVADKLGIPFYAGYYKDAFQKHVIDYFVESYKKGLTPNPCAKCNEHLKFDLMLQRADELGCEFLATGHYARIERDGGAPRLLRGLDSDKDQSYFLFTMSEAALARTLFPVGELPKDEVRRLADKFALPVASKPDSQEICFIPDSGYVSFVEQRISDARPGKFVDSGGNVIGEHRGVHAYTIGQRRGLGLGGMKEPMFVTKIDADRNEIVVGPASELMAPAIQVGIACLASDLPREFDAQVQIRYRHRPVAAHVTRGEGGKACVRFAEPEQAATPGQAAVFYDGARVLGGGWIEEVLP